ncbi:Uncharacterised protein [uncultured archaeon]|nr:Uncharacterised protein [uncultured archaeon]
MLMGVKRVYDKRDLTDGKRILVERLWPRGVKKSTQSIDVWMKEVAPSTELRKWFSHEPAKWQRFKEKYFEEIRSNRKVDELISLTRSSDVTLVYSAKDTEHNSAIVLAEFLKEKV